MSEKRHVLFTTKAKTRFVIVFFLLDVWRIRDIVKQYAVTESTKTMRRDKLSGHFVSKIDLRAFDVCRFFHS